MPSPTPVTVWTGWVTTPTTPLPTSTAPLPIPPAATAILSTCFNWAMAATSRARCAASDVLWIFQVPKFDVTV